MQKSELVKLLTFKHSIEGGEVVESEVEAWHLVIGDLDYFAAMEVAVEHYRGAEIEYSGSAPRLMPRHLVEACKVPLRGASDAGNVTEQRLARGEVTA